MTVEFDAEKEIKLMTKRQHYVQQAYLEQWCVGGRFAVRVDGRLLENQTPLNYANEKWFYAFVDLTARELDYLFRSLMQVFDFDKHDLARKMFGAICLNVLRFRCENMDYDAEYDEVYHKIVSSIKFDDEWDKMFAFLKKGAQGDNPISPVDLARFKERAAEGFESFQCNVEEVAAPCFKMAREDGLSFMKDKATAHALILYLVNQAFRGPDYLKMIDKNLPESIRADGGTAELAKYMRYFQPLLVAATLAKESEVRKMMVINNATDVDFITGDVPLVIYGERHSNVPCIIYYPLTPHKGLLYGFKSAVNDFNEKFTSTLRRIDKVDWFNREIIASSMRAVFATTKETLQRYGVDKPQSLNHQ